MIVLLVCTAVVTFVVGQVESNAYSTYTAPQRPCSGGSFCGGHPNSLPFEPRYPSVRVGVSPGYPGESESNYESNEAPEYNYSAPTKEVAPCAPPPPSPTYDESQLPVSVCVQLPPKTPLKLSKSILQQIISSLTESHQEVEPVVDPVQPEPVTVPVYAPQQPVYPPQPAYAPPPPPPAPQAPLAPQQPVYPPQPSYPPPPPPPPPAYVESPAYPPQPVAPVKPAEPVYEQEPVPTVPVLENQTPRYPTYESGSASGSGPVPPYVQQSRPGGACLSCGSSLKPRYNQ